MRSGRLGTSSLDGAKDVPSGADTNAAGECPAPCPAFWSTALGDDNKLSPRGFDVLMEISALPDWYEQIEPGVRDIVRLLRDNGFNTTSSCEHNMEIQFANTHDADEAERLARFLHAIGHRGFTIQFHIEVPPNGYWARTMAVKLDGWPGGGACFAPAWAPEPTKKEEANVLVQAHQVL